MNRKLYAKIYKDNPGDPTHPIYVGGHYEKEGGLPAKGFRLRGALLSAAAVALLVAAGVTVSVPGRTMYCTLPYAVAYLPAVLCLFAFLQAPGDDGPVREDTYHNVFVRVQACSVIGMALGGISLIGGIVATVIGGHFGLGEAVFLAATAAAAGCFAGMRVLWKKQHYRLKEKAAR